VFASRAHEGLNGLRGGAIKTGSVRISKPGFSLRVGPGPSGLHALPAATTARNTVIFSSVCPFSERILDTFHAVSPRCLNHPLDVGSYGCPIHSPFAKLTKQAFTI
jgi:hypothetical protein